MSVIAWDGSVLAADRQGCTAELRVISPKIKLLGNGEVLAWTGSQDCGLALVEWYESGADRLKFPEFQKNENDWTRLIVGSKDGVKFFERQPYAQVVLDEIAAWGSGRDFALGAMAMGADAIRAVEVTNRFSVGCGFGVDSFRLK